MNEITRFVSSLSNQKHIELEMLRTVLLDETAYPWEPAEELASPCLDRLEAAVESVLSSHPVVSQWDCLLEQAKQLWGAE